MQNNGSRNYRVLLACSINKQPDTGISNFAIVKSALSRRSFSTEPKHKLKVTLTTQRLETPEQTENISSIQQSTRKEHCRSSSNFSMANATNVYPSQYQGLSTFRALKIRSTRNPSFFRHKTSEKVKIDISRVKQLQHTERAGQFKCGIVSFGKLRKQIRKHY